MFFLASKDYSRVSSSTTSFPWHARARVCVCVCVCARALQNWQAKYTLSFGRVQTIKYTQYVKNMCFFFYICTFVLWYDKWYICQFI